MILVAERLSKVFLLALRYISAFFFISSNKPSKILLFISQNYVAMFSHERQSTSHILFVCLFFKQIPLIHSSEPLSIVTIESIFSGSKITAALHFKVICLYEDKLQNFTHQASG